MKGNPRCVHREGVLFLFNLVPSQVFTVALGRVCRGGYLRIHVEFGQWYFYFALVEA